jgi:hypothetical protein
VIEKCSCVVTFMRNVSFRQILRLGSRRVWARTKIPAMPATVHFSPRPQGPDEFESLSTARSKKGSKVLRGHCEGLCISDLAFRVRIRPHIPQGNKRATTGLPSRAIPRRARDLRRVCAIPLGSLRWLQTRRRPLIQIVFDDNLSDHDPRHRVSEFCLAAATPLRRMAQLSIAAILNARPSVRAGHRRSLQV